MARSAIRWPKNVNAQPRTRRTNIVEAAFMVLPSGMLNSCARSGLRKVRNAQQAAEVPGSDDIEDIANHSKV